MDKLIRIAKENKVEVIDNGNGHIQLKGKLLVNYYPESKKKTAYVAGTTGSSKYVGILEAVRMANAVPLVHPNKKAKRLKSYKNAKKKLLAKKPFCHWCGEHLTEETATIEHIIPLAKGGLNNHNNYALACESCNLERGCDMPEINKRA